MSDETGKTRGQGPDRIAQLVGVVVGVTLGAYIAWRAVNENDNSLVSGVLIFLLIGVPAGLFAVKFVEAVRAFLSGDLFDDWERMSRVHGEATQRKADEERRRNAAARSIAAGAPAASPAAAVAAGVTGSPPSPADRGGAAPKPPEEVGTRPPGLDEPRGEPDDLTKLKGVGPKVAAWLNSKGYWHYDQIAAWDEDEIAWIDANLEGVKNRASRDDWVAQARALADETKS